MSRSANSAFAPFRHRVFAVLWAATLISNIGTWMFNVTSGWLMTELNPSPLMVSLVQATTALPIFLFALPAGALGDIFNRRTLLLITQILSMGFMVVFAGLVGIGMHNAWVLLLFTFLTGAGAAFANPAFQAIVPQLVPKDALQSAIALNGVSVNIARAIGPALGGFILAVAGAVATILMNAASFVVVIGALLWWHTHKTAGETLPREHLVGAMRAGVRFALRSKALRHTMMRALAFFPFASAYWALLPLVAKDLLQGGPGLYGSLLTALGVGAVAGTFLLAKLKRYANPNQRVVGGTLGTALGMVVFAYGGSEAAGLLAGLIAGFSWIVVLSSFNVSVQLALPDWVRARGLALFQMMFFGAMTVGSIVWGQMAAQAGMAQALSAASVLMLVALLCARRFQLNLAENHDHTPSGHWPEPILLTHVSHDYGPVLVTIEYRIADADRAAFEASIRELGESRRRDGAITWGYFENVADHGCYIEMFTVESWVEHLRQHKRVSAADKALQDKIGALHQGEQPRVTHAVTPRPGASFEPIPEHHHD